MRIEVKRGLDVQLKGNPRQVVDGKLDPARVALVLDDFPGLKPKLEVREGERVALGQRLFSDRLHPEVIHTAVAAGRIAVIERGGQRSLRHVVIERDGDAAVGFPVHEPAAIAGLSATAVRETLLRSGLWVALRARPLERVADPAIEPRALFVTAIDTNPLAPDPVVILAGEQEAFSCGLQAVSQLTSGPTFVCTAAGVRIALPDSGRLRHVEFAGPHPAGLPGTHLHAMGLRIGPQPDLWHMGYQDVIALGRLLLTGRLAATRVIALAGPAAPDPRLVRAHVGAELAEISPDLATASVRVISGSPLCGTAPARFLGRYANQVTLLPEPDASRKRRYSWLGHAHRLVRGARAGRSDDTALNGPPAGMLPIETMEAVWPFRGSPLPLLRALLIGDPSEAVRFGCLGLATEDLALLSYVCPAKRDYGEALKRTLESWEQFA